MSPVRFWEAPPRFASHLASVAQLVEHRIRNARVAGSNPVGGSKFESLSSIYASYKTQELLRFMSVNGINHVFGPHAGIQFPACGNGDTIL